MKKLAIAAALAVLAMPATASAHGKSQSPVRAVVAACKAERASTGADAFKQKYANKRGKRAMKRCVGAHVRQATRDCRTERKADRAGFRAQYGKGAKKRRAFVRCVKQKMSAAQPAA